MTIYSYIVKKYSKIKEHLYEKRAIIFSLYTIHLIQEARRHNSSFTTDTIVISETNIEISLDIFNEEKLFLIMQNIYHTVIEMFILTVNTLLEFIYS